MSNQFGGAVCGLIYSKKSVPYPPSEKKHSFFFFKKKRGGPTILPPFSHKT
jgi:hypothetical protein